LDVPLVWSNAASNEPPVWRADVGVAQPAWHYNVIVTWQPVVT